MTTTQRRGRVKSHTRYVNGKPQRVRSHRRTLQPARARMNLGLAWRSLRHRNYGRAAVGVGIAAAEIGGWLALRGFGVAAVTLGIGATAAGVSAIRATKARPKPIRESRLLTAGPDHEKHRWTRGREESPYELGLRHGQADAATNWKGPFEHTPTYGDGDPRSAEYERGYSKGAGWGDDPDR